MAIGVLLFVTAALLRSGAAEANHTPITTTTDSNAPGSLRSALADAVGGETVVVPPGTYALTLGELLIDQAITLDGAGPGATIVDAQGNSRVFRVSVLGATPPPVTVADMTVTGGAVFGFTVADASGGGILNQSSALTLSNSVVTGNQAVGQDGPDNHGGGGIYNASGGVQAIVNSTVSNNTSFNLIAADGGGGGGVYAGTGTLEHLLQHHHRKQLVPGRHQPQCRGRGRPRRRRLARGHQQHDQRKSSNRAGRSNQRRRRNLQRRGGCSHQRHSLGQHDNRRWRRRVGLERADDLACAGSSIVAASNPTGCGKANQGTVTSDGGNFETAANTCNLVAGDFPSTDPLIGPLAFNGGPTQTHALPG